MVPGEDGFFHETTPFFAAANGVLVVELGRRAAHVAGGSMFCPLGREINRLTSGGGTGGAGFLEREHGRKRREGGRMLGFNSRAYSGCAGVVV